MINQFNSSEILKIRSMISIRISILIREIRDVKNSEEKAKLTVELNEYKEIHSKLESWYLETKNKELEPQIHLNGVDEILC